MRAATRESTAAASAAGSSRGTVRTRKGVSGKSYHFAEPSVTAAAAAVRPWNPPRRATTVSLPGRARKARRRAFSFASAPLFTKKGPVEALGSETDERGGGGAAVRARNRVGLEEEPGGGGPERFQHRRVPVAEPADGVAAVEIEQRPPVGGAESDPVAGCDLDRQLGVNGKEMR